LSPASRKGGDGARKGCSFVEQGRPDEPARRRNALLKDAGGALPVERLIVLLTDQVGGLLPTIRKPVPGSCGFAALDPERSVGRRWGKRGHLEGNSPARADVFMRMGQSA